MPCRSRMPNCGTQFCFHRNQFEGIFIFNYSATSNFPFTPRPDRRREIAYVNHPRKPLTSLKSPLHRGSLAGALGMCPGFSETNGDTRWPSAPDSGTLAVTCSPCQGERQKISMPVTMTCLGTRKRKQPPDSFLLDCPHSSSRPFPNPWKSQKITVWTPELPPPIPMTLRK